MQSPDAVAGPGLALGLIALRSQYENGINCREDEGAKVRCRQLGEEIHKKELGAWSYG